MWLPGLKRITNFKERLTDVLGNKNSAVIFYIFITIILLFLLHKMIYKGLFSIKEGNENMSTGLETLPQKLKNKNIDLQGKLLLQTRRQDYEDTILALDDSVHLHILRLIKNYAGKISEDSSKAESKAAIKEINDLYKLKEALNSSVEFMDKQ